MNKKLIGFLVLLLLIVISVFVLTRDKIPKSVLDSDRTTLYRLQNGDELSDIGFLHLPYSVDAEGFPFVTVGVDLNQDGTLASYEVDNVVQEEWLIIDMRANISTDSANRYTIQIPDRSINERLPLTATAIFADEKPTPNGAGAYVIPKRNAIVETFTIADYRTDNIGIKFQPDETGLNEVGPSRNLFKPNVAWAQKAGDPGYGVEYGTFPEPDSIPDSYAATAKGMPDLDQAHNECAPTAIANSFRWLAKENGFENRIPESDQALIDEIKGYTEWSSTGVKPGNSLKGKQEFIRARGLPLEAHIIADERNPQFMFYKIYQEMAKGQAVEVSLQFWENGRPAGAHLVTVKEVYRARDGRQWITLHDPATDARTDRSSGDVYRFDSNGNTIVGYYSGGTTTIRYAIAQSPIKEVVDGTWVDPWQDSTVLIGTDVDLRQGSEVSLGISQWRFFNVTIDDPGDHLVGDTFDVTARVLKRTDDTMKVEVGTSTYEFKAEEPWNLAGSFKSSSNLTISPQTNKPPRTNVGAGTRQYTVTTQFICTKPGIAHVTYNADIGWTQTSVDGDIPERISKYYAKELQPGDSVEVQSPPFRCIGVVTEEQQEDSRTAMLTTCGIVQDPNGVEIEALVLDDKCYPKPQFREADPDRCDSKHWHGGKVYSLDGEEKDDPNPDGCGYGKINEVEVRQVKIDQATAAKFLGSMFEDLEIPEDAPLEYEYNLNSLDSYYLNKLGSGIQFDYTIDDE